MCLETLFIKFSKKKYFYFDEKLIPLTSDHKHLGITFSEEAKWNKHVENRSIQIGHCFSASSDGGIK
jgi:hypothetical protein